MPDTVPAGTGVRRSHVSPARQRLVRLVQTTHFGRVQNLFVRRGEPVFDPPPQVVRTLKIAGRAEPRPAVASDDFVLCREYVDLLEHLARLGDGVVQRIEVAHGLPLLIEVQDELA